MRRNILIVLSYFLKLLPIYNRLVLNSCTIIDKQKISLLGRLVAYTFWQEYWKLPLGERMDAQQKLMGNNAGVDWAKDYQLVDIPAARGLLKVGALDFFDAIPGYEKIDQYLTKAVEECTVIQLGASSGKDIVYFAKKHPRHIFYYTDIFDSVVKYSESIHNQKNIKFLTSSAEYLHLIASATCTKNVVVFSMGSSQYVYPENLDKMFARLSKIQDKEIVVFIDEPADNIKNDPLSINGSLIRGNFSYTHNYSYYANRNGFDTVAQIKISPYIPQEDYFPLHQGTVLLSGIFVKY